MRAITHSTRNEGGVKPRASLQYRRNERASYVEIPFEKFVDEGPIRDLWAVRRAGKFSVGPEMEQIAHHLTASH